MKIVALEGLDIFLVSTFSGFTEIWRQKISELSLPLCMNKTTPRGNFFNTYFTVSFSRTDSIYAD